jgi:hypothetical protein
MNPFQAPKCVQAPKLCDLTDDDSLTKAIHKVKFDINCREKSKIEVSDFLLQEGPSKWAELYRVQSTNQFMNEINAMVEGHWVGSGPYEELNYDSDKGIKLSNGFLNGVSRQCRLVLEEAIKKLE